MSEVELIDKKIVFLKSQLTKETKELSRIWSSIKEKCTHPFIGENTYMYECPDCGWSGAPIYPEELSDRDYQHYGENIKKKREFNQKLKSKYSRDEVKNTTKEIRSKLNEVKLEYGKKIRTLELEKSQIINEKIKNCSHSNLHNNYCADCNVNFVDSEKLF